MTAFFIAPPTISTIASRQQSYNHPLIVANSVTDESANEVTLTNPNEMRLREIQTELKERNVSYADCFDRESLVKRLIDARENHPAVVTPSQPMESSQAPDTDDVTAKDDATTITAGSEFDKEATIAELRELRVKVLKEKLSEY